MNGDLKIYPKSGYVVAVLANLDPPAAQRISDYVDARLPTDESDVSAWARLLESLSPD